MNYFRNQIEGRLFTYKVMFDAGSAPNPYGGICTLAICKPKIRSVAKVGDVVVGLAPGDEGRIIYCMIISDVKSWADYIKACKSEKLPSSKIPKSDLDQGDCIWKRTDHFEEALPSWSSHDGDEHFCIDVKSGRNVLLANEFWYFGDGAKHKICLPKSLHKIIPGRGHRSNSNANFRTEFFVFFNESLHLNSISSFGLHGTPDNPPTRLESDACRKCRAMQKIDDAV